MVNRLEDAQARLQNLKDWGANLDQHVVQEGVRKPKFFIPHVAGGETLNKRREYENKEEALDALKKKKAEGIELLQRDVWMEETIQDTVARMETEIRQTTQFANVTLAPIQKETIAWALPHAEEELNQALGKLYGCLDMMTRFPEPTKEKYDEAVARLEELAKDDKAPDFLNVEHFRKEIRPALQRVVALKSLLA